jgi:hypothetical protein
MSQTKPIRIATSIGDVEVFLVAPMHWEVVYPRTEENDALCGSLDYVRARVERTLEQYEKSAA